MSAQFALGVGVASCPKPAVAITDTAAADKTPVLKNLKIVFIILPSSSYYKILFTILCRHPFPAQGFGVMSDVTPMENVANISGAITR
jgi:hypothetical protein